MKPIKKQLLKEIKVVIESAVDIDWIWDGKDEIRTEEFSVKEAMKGIKEILKYYKVNIGKRKITLKRKLNS